MTETAAPATTTKAIAKRSYEPYGPVGTVGGLQSLLDTQRDRIAQVLPKHVTPERILKTMMVAQNRNPDILKCTQSSVLECINRAAELGLDLSGTLGEAYPVPFNNKIKVDGQEKWVMQLTLIIGYRGMEKLAWQSGEVAFIDAEVVCINDHFVFKKGTEVLVEWTPAFGDRGEVLGAYACVGMKTGGKMARFMTRDDIEKIRQGAKSKDSPAWKNHWPEMARKTVLKRTLKDCPLSTEKYVAVMEHDDEDHGMVDVIEATTVKSGDKGKEIKDAFRRNQRQQEQPQELPASAMNDQQQEQPGVQQADTEDNSDPGQDANLTEQQDGGKPGPADAGDAGNGGGQEAAAEAQEAPKPKKAPKAPPRAESVQNAAPATAAAPQQAPKAASAEGDDALKAKLAGSWEHFKELTWGDLPDPKPELMVFEQFMNVVVPLRVAKKGKEDLISLEARLKAYKQAMNGQFA